MRCVLKRLKTGKFKFRDRGAKCSPGKASAAKHAKKFGYSGSKAHKAHALTQYHKRLENLKKARAAPRRRKIGPLRPNGKY